MKRLILSLLFEDEHLLVLNKPPGLAVVPERGPQQDTILDLLVAHLGHESPDIVHRLDKGVSGALLVAKTKDAARELSRQFEERCVEKCYWALVDGEVAADEGRIEAPLAADPRDRTRVRVDPRGKASRTDYRVLERFRGYALVELAPLTGRTHQLRVHLAHLGHPLASDERYGVRPALLLSQLKRGYRESRRGPETPLIARPSLHARAISFAHPIDGRIVSCEASLPKDFQHALNALRKYRPR